MERPAAPATEGHWRSRWLMMAGFAWRARLAAKPSLAERAQALPPAAAM